jgi:hypothetical protein
MIPFVPTGTRSARRVAVLALALTAGTVLAACSSSAKPASSHSPSAGVTPSTSAAASASGSGSAGKPADAATTAAVTTAFQTFFNSKTPEGVSIGLLQDGEAFKSALEAQGSSPMAQDASVTVSKVSMRSPNTASVVFTVLLKGSPVLKDNPGYAVRENGTWKVAGQTFCALLTLQGGTPPACNTPAATALPN